MARENEMMVYSEKLVCSVKVGGRILREHDRDHVYLPFGSEYSLLFKNLDTRRCVVTLTIDGQDVMAGHQFVIGANQTAEIERFIVNGNLSQGPRFKFIEKTEQISEHRGDRVDDGIIRIEYQFEHMWNRDTIKSIIHHHHHYDYNPLRSSFHNPQTFGASTGDPVASYHHTTSGNVNSRGVQGQSVSQSNVTMDSLDDGITVHGGDSSQQFNLTEVGMLDPQTHSIIIKLHGTRDKAVIHTPVTIQAKFKCDTCGTTNTSRNKFCGGCGTNLTW